MGIDSKLLETAKKKLENSLYDRRDSSDEDDMGAGNVEIQFVHEGVKYKMVWTGFWKRAPFAEFVLYGHGGEEIKSGTMFL